MHLSKPIYNIELDLEGTDPDGTFLTDMEYIKGLGDLDECNGTNINGTYAYLITDVYPYIGRCLMGEYKEPRRMGPPPGGRGPRGIRPGN